MDVKLFDSEFKVMELIWREGDLTAKQISQLASQEYDWSKTTTYTVIKKCVSKGVIERREPNFICHPMITKEEVQRFDTQELISKRYNGAADQLVSNLLGSGSLSKDEIQRLKDMIKMME